MSDQDKADEVVTCMAEGPFVLVHDTFSVRWGLTKREPGLTRTEFNRIEQLMRDSYKGARAEAVTFGNKKCCGARMIGIQMYQNPVADGFRGRKTNRYYVCRYCGDWNTTIDDF